MRTTIDLDDVLLTRLRDEAHREGVSFRALLHRVILRGLEPEAPAKRVEYKAPAFSMGPVREGILKRLSSSTATNPFAPFDP